MVNAVVKHVIHYESRDTWPETLGQEGNYNANIREVFANVFYKYFFNLRYEYTSVHIYICNAHIYTHLLLN